MSISVTSEGNFNKTESLLKRIKTESYLRQLDGYARQGVNALKAATPVDTGLTAASWDYAILTDKDSVTITWTNSRTIDGYYYGSDGKTPLVLLLVYGHADRGGTFHDGYDFVTPAIQDTMKHMDEKVWSGVIGR